MSQTKKKQRLPISARDVNLSIALSVVRRLARSECFVGKKWNPQNIKTVHAELSARLKYAREAFAALKDVDKVLRKFKP